MNQLMKGLSRGLWLKIPPAASIHGLIKPKRYACSQVKLAEVGRFVEPNSKRLYAPGQLFLHRIFSYRAAVSFPWVAKIYDHDEFKKSGKICEQIVYEDCNGKPRKCPSCLREAAKVNPQAERLMKPQHKPYYQVLIDERDWPHVRTQTEAVTFLRNNDFNRGFYAIPGLDYVSHDDIIPYATDDTQPIQHELFGQFLLPAANREQPPYEATDTLKDWQIKNLAWLKLTEIHRETTENIRITVMPFYMGCREGPGSPVYWWRYCVRLENLGDMAVQLRERHWRIYSLSGTLQTVRGRGVVGQEPILCPRLPAFQYGSHINLNVPSGHMWGSLRFEREDGYTFDCKVPPFSLESQPQQGFKKKPFISKTFTKSNRPKSDL